MSRGAILVAFVVASSMGLAGCGERAADAPANNAVSAPVNETAPAETNNISQGTNLSSGAPTGGTCGTIAGIQCASPNDFCKHEAGQCNVADASGTCTTRPTSCAEIHQPVCGCDGRTYGNSCEADTAGVSIRDQGRCPG